jgi:PPOX class probable F420-dependent enzyme
MSERLTDAVRAILAAPNFAHFATLRADGTPHVSVTWLDTDGDLIRINSAVGRVKDRNVRRDPRVAVSVALADDAYETVTIDARVESFVTGAEADAHIDALSRAYTGKPWNAVAGQERVIYLLRPERIIHHSA